ncbi:hypothetical protein GQR58_000853 [Nymphon striatum]|nr:hypothetical protein GQR58_000853 [Nymphon striatum]
MIIAKFRNLFKHEIVTCTFLVEQALYLPWEGVEPSYKASETLITNTTFANMSTSTKPIKIESLISVFTDPNSVTHRHTPLRTSHTDDRKDIKILLNGAGHYSEYLHSKYVNIDQTN